MLINLCYPIKDLEKVNVGIITTRVVRIFGDEQLRQTGMLGYELIASVCDATVEQLKELSLIDATRIMFLAWRQSYGADIYISKEYCECGELCFLKHDIAKDEYNTKDFYKKSQAIECMTVDGKHTFNIVIIPDGLSSQSELLQTSYSEDMDEVDIIETLMWSRVVSVDGNTDYDRDALPLKLYKEISGIIAEDTKDLLDVFTIQLKCKKCEKDVSSTISFLDATFLLGD